jgi:phage terminase large subunit-like protein
VGNLEDFIVIDAFANGVGKTSILFAILGAIQWGAPTSAFDYKLYREYPQRWPKRIRIVTESELVTDLGPVQMESAKWWPKGRYQWIKGGKQYNRYWHTDSGFSGEVMTYEQAVKEFEGKTIAINAFIEPPPKPIFNASVARQRMGGINLFDMTPLMNAAWVMDDLIEKPAQEIDGVKVGRVKVIHADIEENCIQHGKNGQLEHSDIQQIISRYDPDELEARAHGRFMHLSGRIYKGFDRAVHVAPEPFEPPADAQIGMICDPAIGKPLALLWRYVDEAGVLNYYDEWPEIHFEGAKDSNLTVTDYAALIRSREAGRTVHTRILDRHFGNVRRTLGGKTLKEEFAEQGVEFTDSYQAEEEVETGIFKVKEYLRFDKTKAIDSLNRPRIRISPKCVNLIAAFERWGRDPKTAKPLEAYKDFMDLVRYDVMSEPAIERPVAWNLAPGPHYGVHG